MPESVTKIGGLTFDSTGRIISRQATAFKEESPQPPTLSGGSMSYALNCNEPLTAQGSPETVLAGVDLHRKNVIHGDFTTNNMLYDKDTKRITAMVDFDFSYTSYPLDEFTLGHSLRDIGGSIRDDDHAIKAAILSGNFTLPNNRDAEYLERWKVAEAWYTAMKKVGAVSPSDINGANKICDMLQFQSLLCPSRPSNESMLERMDDKGKAVLRANTEADLLQWPEEHGF
ncbi:hypothetical protein QQS21_003000 [Conoideocrella luteorostrata]|uniref:non-specific serine/threonine protein kinase n=1 Tax=Conoideocrella luteorostrata TaxID=1105319 RepID=A0AAJ0FWR4_9HYPO|nr:hypothetical protein QQS21_003000 [Conoideocrella luteorostrata]